MSEATKRTGIFYGWRVIIACAVIATFSSSSRFSFTMFLPYLLDDLGWSRAMLGFGLTLHMWIYALGAIATGFIVDKYGPRFIMAAGGIFILFGLVLTSKMTTPMQFYLYYGVILALGVSATLVVPNQSTARKWFVKRAGLATAIPTIGTILGLAVMSLIAPDLINAFGWRNSWLYLGLIMGSLVLLIAVIVIRKDPESMGLYPDGDLAPPINQVAAGIDQGTSVIEDVSWTIGEAFKTRSFWCLVCANICFVFPLMGFMGHIAAWATDIARAANMSPEESIGLIKMSVFFMGIMSIVGSIIGGPLSDKIGRKPVIIGSFVLNALIVFYAIYVKSLTGVLIFGLLAGTFSGLSLPLWSAYMGDIFGRASLATLYGFFIFAGGIIGGSGPVVFGWIFDNFGSYFWAFVLSFVCYTFIICLVLPIRKERK